MLKFQFMSRKIIIAGNWKLNLTGSETEKFLSGLIAETQNLKLPDAVRVLVHPSFTSIATAANSLKNSIVKFGAQNCSSEKSGAYTGEVSVDMILETGADSIIIGHSERREIFHESDSLINAKFKAILSNNKLTAIVCCGESEATRESGKTDTWIESQIQEAFSGVDLNNTELNKVVVAYEPIWAIGTGKTCDSNEANRVIKIIRAKLSQLYTSSIANSISILYGGSVKASNIDELLACSDIDGALIGGAALKLEEFVPIIKSAIEKVKALA
jgi:triosephosphate isomerase (TIM)